MIASLTGRLQRKAADHLVIDVSGVGYQVFVPLSTFAAIREEGDDISLHIHTHVREDSLSLFGFVTAAEKDLFVLLTGVSGIGPKTALAVLSGLSVHEVVRAIQTADDSRLCMIPGIGKKTAARLVLELKDRLRQLLPGLPPSGAGGPAVQHDEDVVSALMNLGYKRPLAEDALKKAVQRRPGLDLQGLIREALNILMKK